MSTDNKDYQVQFLGDSARLFCNNDMIQFIPSSELEPLSREAIITHHLTTKSPKELADDLDKFKTKVGDLENERFALSEKVKELEAVLNEAYKELQFHNWHNTNTGYKIHEILNK